MSDSELRQFLQQAAQDTQQALERLTPLRQTSPEAVLYTAIRYSLFAGGKRLRPALFLASLAACGQTQQQRDKFIPFAAGLEMLHTASLIHDDLPEMDDDDLRRGQPTCHKQYGAAMALLAGDGLLIQAFALLNAAIDGVDAKAQLAAARQVALLAGLDGMVSGQAAECDNLLRPKDEQLLEYIYRGKTCALFEAATVSAGLLCAATEQQLQALRRYAFCLGLAFQIIDDVLDMEGDAALLGKPVGSDAARGLVTYAALKGVAAARQRAQELVREAVLSLDVFGSGADLLRALPPFFVDRSA